MNKEITNPKGQHCEDKLFTLTIITVILVCLPNAFCSYNLTSRSLLKVSASVPGGHPVHGGERCPPLLSQTHAGFLLGNIWPCSLLF